MRSGSGGVRTVADDRAPLELTAVIRYVASGAIGSVVQTLCAQRFATTSCSNPLCRIRESLSSTVRPVSRFSIVTVASSGPGDVKAESRTGITRIHCVSAPTSRTPYIEKLRS
jgi:hypothetical protein